MDAGFNCILFDGIEVLDVLLQDLLERQLVDLAIGDEPPDLLPELLEDALPVGHVLELVSCR